MISGPGWEILVQVTTANRALTGIQENFNVTPLCEIYSSQYSEQPQCTVYTPVLSTVVWD